MRKCVSCGRLIGDTEICPCRQSSGVQPPVQDGFGKAYNPFAMQSSPAVNRGRVWKRIIAAAAAVLIAAGAALGVWYFLLREKSSSGGDDLDAAAKALRKAADSAMQDITDKRDIRLKDEVYIITSDERLNAFLPDELDEYIDDLYKRILKYNSNANDHAYVLVFEGDSCEYAAAADEFDSDKIGSYPACEGSYTIYYAGGAEDADPDDELTLDDVYDIIYDELK